MSYKQPFREIILKKALNDNLKNMTIIYENIVEKTKIQSKRDILIKEPYKKYFVEKQHYIHIVFYSVPT